MALLLALGYDAFLRTGELLNLTEHDVSFDARGAQGVVSLAFTKTGQRTASFEALPILDPLIHRLWCLHRRSLQPGTNFNHFIWPYATQRFYDIFNDILVELKLNGLGFRPYSLRRGGATAWYRRTANLSSTIERGRWASVKTGRIYICDGIGRELELSIPADATKSLRGRGFTLNAILRKAGL